MYRNVCIRLGDSLLATAGVLLGAHLQRPFIVTHECIAKVHVCASDRGGGCRFTNTWGGVKTGPQFAHMTHGSTTRPLHHIRESMRRPQRVERGTAVVDRTVHADVLARANNGRASNGRASGRGSVTPHTTQVATCCRVTGRV